MATKEDYEKTGATAGAKVHKIRITLTSRNVKNLEKCGCLHDIGLNQEYMLQDEEADGIVWVIVWVK